MTEVDKILEQINEDVQKPFVTARFGDGWKKHAESFGKEELIDIAWQQGRKAILLENYLRKKYNEPLK